MCADALEDVTQVFEGINTEVFAPRVGGSIPSLGTTSKPVSVRSLRSFKSLWNLPEMPSRWPSCVPSCACENLSVAKCSQLQPKSS
jgi:hypothetical protein